MTNYNDPLVLYNMASVIYGGTVAANWQIDTYGVTGALGSVIDGNVTFKEASITWSLDGPGSAEIDLVEDDTGSKWLSGRRRVKLSRNGTAMHVGYLNNVSAQSQGYPHMTTYRCSLLGWASILDFRVVHGDFSQNSVVGTTIAWNLINHTNAQEDTGITSGAVVGTATSFTRHYCDGDIIGEEIQNLSERDTGGFDWEVDATGAFKAWVGGRGTNKTGSITLTLNPRLDWTEEAETSDVVTYVTAMGEDPDGPCGPPLSVQTIALSGYPRREVVVDAERFSQTELVDAANDEIKARQRARVRVQTTMHVNDLPWAVGTGGVWLGDTINVATNAAFGGTQVMRCIEVTVSLERGASEWWTYTFEAV